MPAFRFFKKNILIISPEDWDYIKVSKHHYAQILASKNNSVYFLNPPDKAINGIRCKAVAENLFVLDYKDPYIGVRFLPKPVRKFLNKRLYEKFQRLTNVKFDTVFLFENSRFYDLDFLPEEVLSIYFQVDEDQNFHPGIAAKTADVAIAINDIIQKILSPFKDPVYKISHGFSGQFSANSLKFFKGQSVYKKREGRIKAYYVGNLDNGFIDTELLTALIQKRQEVDFVLIGPYSENGRFYGRIRDSKNVRTIGKVPANVIPELLDDSDILFFVYRNDFLSASHKVMEYLASGKAIVTTQIKGYEEDPDLFYCSGTAEKFIDLFDEVCANIEEANRSDKMKKRIQFAMDNTYEARILQLETLIEQGLRNKR